MTNETVRDVAVWMVIALGGACMTALIFWAIEQATDRIARVLAIHGAIIDYVWHRKAFKEWRKNHPDSRG